MNATTNRYLEPGTFTRTVFNPLIGLLTRLGLSVWGSRELAVRGRTSGEIRRTPVNVLTVDGERFLVAPRGETQWVRNLRAAGTCDLRVGRRVETVTATELTDDAKPAVLRPYLRRWKWEVGQFFEGIDEKSPDEALLATAPGFPVFRITSA